jgi:hypothetical protein
MSTTEDNSCKTDVSQKLIVTVWSTLIFLLISSQFMYKITNYVGLHTINKNGCPSVMGYILHSIVFGILVFLSMYLSMPKV